MVDNVASLGLEVNSGPVKEATQDLKNLAPAAKDAGGAVDGLNKSFVGLGSAVKGSTFGGGGSSANPFTAMTAGIAAANKSIDTVAPKVQGMGAAITAAILKSTVSFADMTKGVSGILPHIPSNTTDAVNHAASAHGGMSGQMQAAAHSVRSLAEQLLAGNIGVQSFAQQIGHLSFAASGPGGLTAAFAGAARALGPTLGVIGGVAAAVGIASVANALEVYNAVRDVAHRTGIEYDTLAGAVQQASQGFGIAADKNVIYANSADKTAKDTKKLTETFGELGKIMQTAGETAETEGRVFAAIGSSFQKTGTLTADAFQKILDTSPSLARAISNAFGFEDISRFQTQLALTPITLKQLEDQIDRIKPAIDRNFDNKTINTVEQSTRQLTERWNEFKIALADVGAFNLVLNTINAMTSATYGLAAAFKAAADAKSVLGGNGQGGSSNSTYDALGNVTSSAGGPGPAGTGNSASLSNPFSNPNSGDTIPSDIVAGGNFDMPGFASGTDSAPGGLATINEQGGEIVNLPDGSQVIPHDVSMAMAGGASVKQITDAISQSTIDISKAVVATSNNIVSALNKIGGGGSATTNPTTGLALPSSSSSTAINPITGMPMTTSGGGGGGGGGFSFKANPTDVQHAQAIAAAMKASGGGGAASDPMYAAGLGLSIRGSRGSGTFPAGAPINPNTSAINPNYAPSSSSTGYPAGLGGEDARSSLDYGTGSTVYGASSGYSSDYGGSGFGNSSSGFDPNAMNYGGGSSGEDYGYFKTGGQFTVGGPDGVDKSIVKIHASKGETVTVTPKGVSVPSFGSGAGGGSGSSDPSQNVSGGSNTSTKNVIINVMPGIQADSFLKSRAQIARGL